MFLNKADTINKMNEYGRAKFPFLFLFSFDMDHNLVLAPNDISPVELLYDIDSKHSNTPIDYIPMPIGYFNKFPVSYERYSRAFKIVQDNLHHGNSYLLNLTFPSVIDTDCGLRDIYYQSKSKYKLYLKDTFLCFSPEIFVKIKDGIISSYPMKGTIDAAIPNALDIIISDKKEIAEHYTIVDLIRNDLSIVADDVRVDKFRYHEIINTSDKQLIQISSKISGKLSDGYEESIGDIIFKLLPAGSVTGAPKKKTVEIILEAEQYDRSFYTGVFGYFDGRDLDSTVIIRYIEQNGDEMVFKSGGGITINSDLNSEYQELINKIYVPTA